MLAFYQTEKKVMKKNIVHLFASSHFYNKLKEEKKLIMTEIDKNRKVGYTLKMMLS